MLRRAAELAAADRPFVLATVVAVKRPTSARPGAHGIIHPDRSVEGWVGGSCARPVVVKEALRCLADGRSRLLRLSPEPPAVSEHDGIVEHPMTCHSGGTLEIFVEPHLPAPALWVAGITPVAGALAELGAAAGFRVTLLDPDAGPDAFPGADRILNRSDLGALEPEARPFVVVATQGQWDEEAVEAALRRDAAYVGLVASPKRAAVVREYLADAGLPRERIDRLRAPAGLDLGAESPEEIAVSILAELVAIRRRSPGTVPSERSAAPEPAPAERSTARTPEQPAEPVAVVLLDPVCAMTVEREYLRYMASHDGVTYAFCSLTCKKRFEKDPAAYLPASTGAAG